MDSDFYRLARLALVAALIGFAGMTLAGTGIALLLWAVNAAGPPPRRRRAAFRCPACGRKLRLPAGLTKFQCPGCGQKGHRDPGGRRPALVAELIRLLMNPGRN